MEDGDMEDVIWESVLDDTYTYTCRVTRSGEYTGTLRIWVDDRVIMEKEISLSYDAMFGPDAADVNDWMMTCADYVDEWVVDSEIGPISLEPDTTGRVLRRRKDAES